MFEVFKLAPKAVLKYVAFAPISLFMNVAVMATSPLWAGLSMIFGPKLPYPLNLVHTHDDDLDGGQHQLDWPKEKGFKLWKQRMAWICRNPAYGFDAEVLGFKTKGMKIIYSKESPWYNNAGVKQVHVFETADGKRYFGFRWQIPYGKKYCKMWFGWHSKAKDGINHMLKFDFHPFKNND